MQSSTNLDVLRAIAVLTVFAAHITHCVGGPEHAAYGFVEAIGRFGVIIFFLHTSLVLMFSLDRSSLEPAFAARFYVRRAFRIYPLSILAVSTTFLLHLPPNAWSRLQYHTISTPQLISNLLLMQNITQHPPVLSPLWSLPLEVQMYVVLPLLYLLVRSKRWHMRLLACLGIAFALAWILERIAGKLNLAAFIPCFLAGIMAFKRADHKRILPAWIWVLQIPLLVCSAAALPWYQQHFLRLGAISMEWAVAWALGFSWPMFHEVAWKPLVRTGALVAKYSYGIYLAHTYACYLAFVKLKCSSFIGVFVAVALTGTMAVLAYHLVEEPFISIGKRLALVVGRKDKPDLVEIAAD